MHKNVFTESSASATAGRILAELWTDFICPWCGVGERRFAEALSGFALREHVVLVRRSFRLMPGEAPRTVESFLAERYELLPEEIGDALKGPEDAAREVGLTYRLSGGTVGDTMDAHRLLRLARRCGAEEAFYREASAAAMGGRASIFDHGVLTELAVSAGLDQAEVRALLSGDRYKEDVEADEAAMRAHGGNSVPFFVFNGSRRYAGALAPDVFLDALNTAWKAAAPQEAGTFSDDSGCGPDGCLLP